MVVKGRTHTRTHSAKTHDTRTQGACTRASDQSISYTIFSRVRGGDMLRDAAVVRGDGGGVVSAVLQASKEAQRVRRVRHIGASIGRARGRGGPTHRRDASGTLHLQAIFGRSRGPGAQTFHRRRYGNVKSAGLQNGRETQTGCRCGQRMLVRQHITAKRCAARRGGRRTGL